MRLPRRARPPLGASRRRWRGSWPWSMPRRGPRTDRRRRRRRRSRRWSLRLPVLGRRRPNGSSEGHRPRPASSRRESRRRRRGQRRDGWIRHGRRCPSRTTSRRQPRRSRARPSLSRRKRAHLPNTAIVGSRTDAEAGRLFVAELWVIPHRMRFSQRDWSRRPISTRFRDPTFWRAHRECSQNQRTADLHLGKPSSRRKGSGCTVPSRSPHPRPRSSPSARASAVAPSAPSGPRLPW